MHPTKYIVPHPETASSSGPGVWFNRVTAEDKELWNIAWTMTPSIDRPGGMNFNDARIFIGSLAPARQVGRVTIQLQESGNNVQFSLVELSNLLSFEKFFPLIMSITKRGSVSNAAKRAFEMRKNGEYVFSV